MMTLMATSRDLLGLDGTELGTSNWVEITQDMVDQFAASTGDRQWIHVDPERARSGPFGTTIVHGYMTLALAPMFIDEVLHIHSCDAVLNYGVNRVRFTSPVPVGSKVRGTVSLLAARERGAHDVEATFALRYDVAGRDRPACFAETVYLYR